MSNNNRRKRIFHATVHVTRVEEWCVEADTPEEAQALIASGEGHRCSPGEALYAEVAQLHND